MLILAPAQRGNKTKSMGSVPVSPKGELGEGLFRQALTVYQLPIVTS